MTRGRKEKPVPSEVGTGQEKSANARLLSLNLPEGEIKFWDDVLDSLWAAHSLKTRRAIQAVIVAVGPGVEPPLAMILRAAELSGARPEPVAAYWGWLRPAAGTFAGPDTRAWKSIFDPYAPVPVLPMDDHETLSALGLCRASVADSEVAPEFMLWPRDPETWTFPEEGE
jgi:hypothetical protein